MRKLTLTAQQFKIFVFPHIAAAKPASNAEFDTSLRLMRKLKDPALTTAIPLTEAEQAVKDRGDLVIPFHQLLEDEASFLLEEAEWQLLYDRMMANRTAVSMAIAEDFATLLASIKAAPEFKVEESATEAQS